MAITVVTAVRATAISGVSSSIITLSSGAAISANHHAIITCVSDNISTTDGETNNHSCPADDPPTVEITKIFEYTNANGAAAAGITVSMFLVRWLVAWPSGGTIDVLFSSNVVDKCAGWSHFSVGAGNRLRHVTSDTPKTGSVDAVGGFGTPLAFVGLPSAPYLGYFVGGKEANTTTAMTATTNWTLGPSVRSRNAASAVVLRSEMRSHPAGTSIQTSPTFTVNGDAAGLLGCFEEYTPASLPRRVSLIN